jgi:hypothetical protein
VEAAEAEGEAAEAEGAEVEAVLEAAVVAHIWEAVVNRMRWAGVEMDRMAWGMDRTCTAVILPKVENSGTATVTLLTTMVATTGVLPKEAATLTTTTDTPIVCSAMEPGCGSTGRITTPMAMIVIGFSGGHASLGAHTGGAGTTPASATTKKLVA